LAAQEKWENNLTNRLCRKEDVMSNYLGLDLLSKDDPSEGAIVAKKLFWILLGLVALGYLGYSFGELFLPAFPEAKIVGCVAVIILGILARRYEQSLPQSVRVQCDFCGVWEDVDVSKSYFLRQNIACSACDQHPDLLYFTKF
jgi:hypothetical protein